MNISNTIDRRRFLKRGAVATGGAALGVTAILSNASCCKAPVAKDEDGEPEFLFVQTCRSATLADGKLTMTGVSPSTLYFSDRPERITGHVTTSVFVDTWDEGDDSFASNNPNAALSIIHEDFPEEIVVVLKNPILADGNLVYDVEVLEGPETANSETASLFIDVIGRPASPVSVAGAHRRHRRRVRRVVR